MAKVLSLVLSVCLLFNLTVGMHFSAFADSATGIRNSESTQSSRAEQHTLNGKVSYSSMRIDPSPIPSQSYTGLAIMPSFNVFVNSTKLAPGKDYFVSYINNIAPGYASVYVIGTGKYSLYSKSTRFLITVPASKVDIKLSANEFVYTGKAITPAVKAAFNGSAVPKDSYTVSCNNNIKIGTATLTVSFSSGYTGTATKTFVITPQKTSLKRVKKASKAFTASWKKNKTAGGYQLQYSTSKKFSKAKTLNIKGSKKTSVTADKLKGNKKYYIRIRACKTVKGKTYYSPWSKAKTVKTRK